MRDFEDELRAALSRTEPPPGFPDRVMARLPVRRSYPRWIGLVAAILLVISSFSAWEVRRQREQRNAAERAQIELKQAMEITASTLETTKSLLQRHLEGRRI